MSHRNHRCPLDGRFYRCEVSTNHAGDQFMSDCMGDVESPCDNHSGDEIARYCIEQGLIDDLPLTPENYGEQNYQVLVREGLEHNSTWL